VAILYISHKLEEIRALCETATILRGGRVVATCDPRAETARSLAEMMIGAELSDRYPPPGSPGEVLLDVALSGQGGLRDVRLTLRRGEVLGIGGIAGNGQEALLAALSGETRLPPGTVTLKGAGVGALGPNARRARGLCTAPEERLGHAAAPDMSLTENAFLSGMVRRRLAPGGLIRQAATAGFASEIVSAFDVRTAGIGHAARSLSGGNLQKFVVGREILQGPDVLAVNQPTWGVDAAAAAFIRGALVRLAREGAGVIVISQDLDELMEVSDRIAILAAGRLSEPVPAQSLTVDAIGRLMEGADAPA
jgi:simple sugar transport system ATP-binding protein